MAKQKRRVSIVVLTYNNLDYTKQCFEYLRQNTDDYEIVVIDNNSQDGSPEYLAQLKKSWPQMRLYLNKENLGFAGGCNQGVALAKNELVCLLNNDTVPLEGWLAAMKRELRRGVGIVGAKLLFPDGLIQHAGIYFHHRLVPAPHFVPDHLFYREHTSFPPANVCREVAGVTAGCFLTTKSVWKEVGGLDESYVKANYEDVDYNLKVRERGYKVVYQPASVVVHFEHVTISSLEGTDEDPMQHWEGNLALLNERWYEKLAAGLVTVDGTPVEPEADYA